MPVVSNKPVGLYLKKAHIKGFKSLEDTVIDFNKGLNIVIGKNAAGKSNILDCLYRTMSYHRSVSKNSNMYSHLEFLTDDNRTILWETKNEIQTLAKSEASFEGRVKTIVKLIIDGKEIYDSSSEDKKNIINYNGSRILAISGFPRIMKGLGMSNITPIFIGFNLPEPEELEGISASGTIQIELENDDIVSIGNLNTLDFLQEILYNTLILFEDLSVDKLDKDTFLERLKISDNIKDKLKRFTPIRDIRFNENIIIYTTDKLITIENIKIDFKVNNDWMPWSQLSDGTRRLFYMVSEIADRESGLVLVEEPELGVHPHQFNLIMEFLKEESDNKQIIISTHSPQALNQLEEDELSRILITTYDSKKGTQVRHLSKPQITKAKKYMKEVGFLSDYWMISDLDE
jgi:predicted ATP-dependent endonuclease of OLD family